MPRLKKGDCVKYDPSDLFGRRSHLDPRPRRFTRYGKVVKVAKGNRTRTSAGKWKQHYFVILKKTKEGIPAVGMDKVKRVSCAAPGRKRR